MLSMHMQTLTTGLYCMCGICSTCAGTECGQDATGESFWHSDVSHVSCFAIHLVGRQITLHIALDGWQLMIVLRWHHMVQYTCDAIATSSSTAHCELKFARTD